MNLAEAITTIISNFLLGITAFLPQLIAGIILLLIGIIVANILSKLFLGLFRFLSPEKLFKDSKLAQSVNIKAWLKLIAELIRWSILILFLVAAVETWGIGKVGDLLNQLLLYLPNVLVAVFLGFVGIIIANLTQDLVEHSAKGLGSSSAASLAALARTAVLVFIGLLVLHQLGVAANLIQILFTGVVLMLALAGGLAFGIGGQEIAKKILNEVYEKIKK